RLLHSRRLWVANPVGVLPQWTLLECKDRSAHTGITAAQKSGKPRIPIRAVTERKTNTYTYVTETEFTSRGLHPGGNHDRRRDHRLAGGDCRAELPARPQAVSGDARPRRPADDRFRHRPVCD